MNELYHFGVKGMRWGFRKKREAHRESSRAFSRQKAYELSDVELNRRINRLSKEKQYKEMTTSSAVRNGKKLAAALGGIVLLPVIGALKGAIGRQATDFINGISNNVSVDELLRIKE